MALPPQPPPAGAPDPVTPEHWASRPPSPAQPLLRQEAKEEEEGEETGIQGAWGTGTPEQRRRGFGEAAKPADSAEEGQAEAGGAAAAGSGSPAGGAGGGSEGWRRLLAWLQRRQPQCCPCAAPLPRSAAHCCHGGTKMAALAYNLGKREINHYFSVRSAKVLALVAVLLLAACHLASRRYRGERALPPARAARGGGGDAVAGGRPPRPTHAHAASRPPGPQGRRFPHVPPGVPTSGPAPQANRVDPSAGHHRTMAGGSALPPAPEPPALGSGAPTLGLALGAARVRLLSDLGSGRRTRSGARVQEVGQAALGGSPGRVKPKPPCKGQLCQE
ncbi:hypothetical protein P7K49_025346 [Saguinus oedipus]|uniref:Uncharacterized protein n=1 Tax=Saguinus oedipus TaxID=9490 RepID=A0ABQ9UGW4_SAGOE|nr:hypothetical protein P7K49_025346 [Saguinus oedipus]